MSAAGRSSDKEDMLKLREKALTRTRSRTRFGRGSEPITKENP